MGSSASEAKDDIRAAMKKYTWKEAFEDARRDAEAGNPGAQNFVGYCYDSGRGVQRDVKIAKHWYQKAARKGQSMPFSILR